MSGIECELAMTLDQIDRTRKLHEELRRNLVRQECYADNELNDMEQRTPKYSTYRFPEREKLQRRLIKIEDTRRMLALKQEDDLRDLHDRLLAVLNRRAHLD